MSLRAIVMQEIRPFLSADGGNVVATGPAVALPSRAALALGMAIHELTTNAVKYGALSVPEGRIAINWRVEDGPDGGDLMLEWIERGGPAVTPPSQRGFGLTLIERGLRHDMGAEVEMEFAAEGVRARLRAPLHGVATADTAPPEPTERPAAIG